MGLDCAMNDPLPQKMASYYQRKGCMKTKEPKFNSLLDVARFFPTEDACRKFFEKQRWGDTVVCPKCSCFRKIYRINDGKLFRCADCGKTFTVKVGTIFEDSPIPLQTWFMAIHLITAHKKGISSCQLARDLNITQKTAWFMLHRIRHIMKTKSFNKPLNGIVEVDETFIGGKEKNKHRSKRLHAGTGGVNKAAVIGMLDRDDAIVVTSPVKRVNAKTLQGMIKSHVHADSTIMSDEWVGYKGLDKHFFGHETVDHAKYEYVRGNVHTNTLDGFWSLLKRGIVGIYHQVSPEHLHRYCGEFEYRYNSRKVKDIDRFTSTLNRCEGRLTYKKLIN